MYAGIAPQSASGGAGREAAARIGLRVRTARTAGARYRRGELLAEAHDRVGMRPEPAPPGRGPAGASREMRQAMKLTWAATMRQPSGMRTHVWL